MSENNDGSVKIGTELDPKGVEKGLKQMRQDMLSATQQIAKSLDDLSKQSQTQATKSANAFSDMAKKVAAAFSVAMIVRFGVSTVKAFGEAQQAVNKLSASLNNVGITSKTALVDFQNFATEMQNFTGLSDETIQNALALATNFGLFGQQAKDTVKAAHALSLGLGMDLNSAMMLLVKAAEGNTDMLGRYGLGIAKTGDKAKDFEEVLRNVNKRFGELATANADTLLVKTKALSEAWGDLKETIGGAIAPALTDILKTLNDIVVITNTYLNKEQQQTAKKTASVWSEVWGAAKDIVTKTIKATYGDLGKFGNFTDSIATGVGGGLEKTIAQAKMDAKILAEIEKQRNAAILREQEAAAKVRYEQERLLAEQRKTLAEKLGEQTNEVERTSLNVQAKQVQEYLQKRAADEKLYGEARLQFYKDEAQRLIDTGKFSAEQITSIMQGANDAVKDKAPTFAESWEIAMQEMSDSAVKTSDIIKNAMASTMEGFDAMGEALARGEDGMKAFAKTSVLALADVVKALATQLEAEAFAALLKKDYAAFGQGIAAAAAMRVAAGVIKAMAGKFATGGFVGGNSKSGDNVLIRANSGELVLNEGQQGNIAQALMAASAMLSNAVALLNKSGGSSGSVEVNIINQANAEVSVAQSNVNNVRTLDIMVKQKVQEFLASPQGANTMSGLYGVGRKGVNNK
ncbi:MAG: hypothetical protein LBD46_04785 [Endomicrobium sp.]|jgi:hypothetical protein|nr:hypothetical protein [Endomicrobium sp.]